MATYPFVANFKPSELAEALRAAFPGHISNPAITDCAMSSSNTALAISGVVNHDGAQTGPQIQAVIDAYIPSVFGSPIIAEFYKRTQNTGTETVTYTPPTSSAARFEVTITASNGTAVKVFKLLTQVKRGAGNAIQVGAPVPLITPQGDAALNNATVTASVSGTNAVLTLNPGAGFSGTCHWLVEITGRVFNP